MRPTKYVMRQTDRLNINTQRLQIHKLMEVSKGRRGLYVTIACGILMAATRWQLLLQSLDEIWTPKWDKQLA